MTPTIEVRRYKAPRWISTEAGQWAYEASDEWRRVADLAFAVSERRRLLDEAELLLKRTVEASQA